MKLTKTILAGSIFLGLLSTANAGNPKLERAEKDIIPSVQLIKEKIKSLDRIERYTPIDSLVEQFESKLFDIKSNSVRTQSLKLLIGHIDKTYLYGSKVTHTEVKSFPAKTAFNKEYIFSTTFTNGDKMIYTMLPKSETEKSKLSNAELENLFFKEGVIKAFPNHLGDRLETIDVRNYIEGFELLDMKFSGKKHAAVFKHEIDNEHNILIMMIREDEQ